jgi:hypothetical protein
MRVINIEAITPEIIIKSNEYKKFRKLLADGYYVFEQKDGYWTLRKRPKIIIVFEYEGKEYKVNLARGLRKYYGKKDVATLIELFKNDFEAGKITLKEISEGYFSIIEI